MYINKIVRVYTLHSDPKNSEAKIETLFTTHKICSFARYFAKYESFATESVHRNFLYCY